MGGKQSTEAATSTGTSLNRNTGTGTHSTASSHPNNAVGSNRRTRAVSSMNPTRNAAFALNGEGLLRTTTSRSHTGSRSDHRQHRSHSTAETTGMRLSRPGFEWFLASNLTENDSSPDDNAAGTSSSRNFTSQSLAHRPANLSRSLPPFFFRPNRDSKCPFCNKMIPAEDVEVHFVMCLTKPRVTYNEDVMSSTAGECSICLDDLLEGETVARLPCLCVYHKTCIDKWFSKSQTCPEHPPD